MIYLFIFNNNCIMEKINIDFVEKNGLLAYKYLRGSHSYHLNVETSDVAYG